MLTKYLRTFVLVLLLGAFALTTHATSPPRPAHAQSQERLVLAFYYTWYSTDLWSSGTTSDVAAELYNSTDPAAIARHVDQARGAGIDGFVASWYGPNSGPNNQTQSNFMQLLDIASARGFRAAVDFETYSPFFGDTGAVIDALKYAIGTFGQHPAYLRFNGKPVIFFWANNRFSPDEWTNIRAQADPNHDSIWIAEGVTTRWLSAFDGLHLYNVAWSTNFAATAAKFAKLTRELGKVWVATAMPGWDDTRVPGRAGVYAKDRASGQFYRDSFSGAAASNPDILIVTSFNEWVEGSQIEPSTSYGDLYLMLTREMTGAYKQGGWSSGSADMHSITSAPTAIPAPPSSTPEPTEAPVATIAPATDTPVPPMATLVPPTATPSPTPPPFDTPVAFIVAKLLEPTATPQPSDTPTTQPSPTLLEMTLVPSPLAPRSVGDAAGATSKPIASGLLMAVTGATILSGIVVVAGLAWRRRR